ncbi:ATP-binding protein [Fulvimarina sp. 2208YS6-2-32]|uniref:ATP-binding protein n=1 Tax=Fulvimarina uroteuthidis TaxID=3098149 RepID=A0ABU5I776_9HYPH|nr:ATP-binding protein [Fulvimarina sp. 2208YS6-2-32]MDY8110778.1 ATP-binding protein [Fulvimarina sp. 2208YS6-2-32]
MKSLPVIEESQVGTARRTAVQAGKAVGLPDDALERLAIVVTEACTNLVRHAVNGELLVDARTASGKGGRGRIKASVTILAIDDGPGIPNVEAAMADGYTTVTEEPRGIGGGMGSMQRQADRFDIYSGSHGTTVMATVGETPGPVSSSPYDVTGLIVPMPGFDAGGDAFAIRPGKHSTMVMLMDVLGHGPTAAEVASTGLKAFDVAGSKSLEDIERQVADALSGSRGAAALIVEIPHAAGKLRAMGLGNVRGSIHTSDGNQYGIPSQPGILGAATRRPRPTEHDWSDDAMLILSTDGLKSSPRVPEPRSLFFRESGIIAATLYKLRRRGSDDAGIVVVRPHT